MNGLRWAALCWVGVQLVAAQELSDYEKKVIEFSLGNGLHFIVLERHETPVISFHTYINVGASQDPAGESGMAQMVSRLAFKGTETIGTKGWAAEKKALDEVDAAVDQMEREREHGGNAGRIASLQSEASAALNAARSLEAPGDFLRILDENGAVQVTSTATPDSIETSYSLPSNRIELWYLMESQRLFHPAFREFYAERDRLVAEINSTVESKAPMKLQESLLANAFEAQGYRNPVLGWRSDVAGLRRSDLKAFVDSYFVPGNMLIAIVGDVDPANAKQLAERYFGSAPSKPLPPAMHTFDAPQLGPKSVALWGSTQPLLMVGYKRPAETNRDDVALDAVRMILGEGHTSRLYKELVEEKKLAQDADAVASIPSGRRTNLFVFRITPAPDHTAEENLKAVDDLLKQFEAKPVDADTMSRVQNVIRGRVLRLLGSNQQLAYLLTNYIAIYGNWRRLFTAASDFTHLTPADLQRVSAQYFTPENRTVAYIGPPQTGTVAGGAQ